MAGRAAGEVNWGDFWKDVLVWFNLYASSVFSASVVSLYNDCSPLRHREHGVYTEKTYLQSVSIFSMPENYQHIKFRIEDRVARHDLTRVVERAMALLPEEQRTAIVLKEYHGLTFQEIADLVGCPLSTVKTRLYQGLVVLRRELARTGASAAAR